MFSKPYLSLADFVKNEFYAVCMANPRLVKLAIFYTQIIIKPTRSKKLKVNYN